jgi:flagellar hook-length control protein FliK
MQFFPFTFAEALSESTPAALALGATGKAAKGGGTLKGPDGKVIKGGDVLKGPDGKAIGALSGTGTNSANDFQQMLANFIEDDRLVYSGRPAGFAAQEENSGTLGNRSIALFKAALRKRQVPEDGIAALDAFLQTGQGLTIGKAFKVLRGEEGRIGEDMAEDERDAFKMLLNKMGLSKDKMEDLVALSDDGKGRALLGELQTALQGQDGKLDVTREEFSSVLKALDLSDDTRKQLLSLFNGKIAPGQDSLSLPGNEVAAILAGAADEFAAREKAASLAKTHMRAAMTEAMNSAKVEQQAAPVDNNRGDRRSEQMESVMRDSARKNTGADHVKQDVDNNDEGHGQDTRNNAWARSWNSADLRGSETKNQARAKSLENNASRMFQRLDYAVGITPNPAGQNAEARNLNSIASKYGKEIFSQVENGILQNAQNGSQRINLQLTPEELGRVNVLLSMRKGELKAVITAENENSAAVLHDQITQLKHSLEEQGIKVAELEVRTELQDNRFGQQWNDHQEHNFMNDTQERDRAARLSRLRRDQAENDPAATVERARYLTETGLHIVA